MIRSPISAEERLRNRVETVERVNERLLTSVELVTTRVETLENRVAELDKRARLLWAVLPAMNTLDRVEAHEARLDELEDIADDHADYIEAHSVRLDILDTDTTTLFAVTGGL